MEIQLDIVLGQKSDSARKPAVSRPTGPGTRHRTSDQIQVDGY